jgi:acyl-CoA reductase-like NAD-dependent aldehyde dehydrogenase
MCLSFLEQTVSSRPATLLAVDDRSPDVPALLELLADSHPSIALSLARALRDADTSTLRAADKTLLGALANDSRLDHDVDVVVSRACAAQEAFANWTDEQVDGLLSDVAKVLAERAEMLALCAVSETDMGNAPDKTIQIRFASLGIYESMAGHIAQGPMSFDLDRQVTEVASPVGVVFAVVPVTSPVATAIFKMLIAIKARNAVILSFHHDARVVGQLTGGIVREILKAHGAPADLVQWSPQPGRKTARRFMRHPSVSLVLATGGRTLVEAAYSSGTPAIGVGPGNAPAWICADADLDRAAWDIVTSKSFDNGLVCGAEHSLVVDGRVAEAFADALIRHGAALLTAEEEQRFMSGAVDAEDGTLLREFTGQSAEAIAAAVGIVRPYPLRILVVRAALSSCGPFHTGEKLAPVLSMFTVAGEDEGLTLCETLLTIAGAGHTAIIHSSSPARVERFARVMRAGRILVNAPGAQGGCGMTTGLEYSLTLGCGTFAGNSTTDNVTYRHLLNVKRVARYRERF